MEMEHTILLVDDEANITRSLSRLFHRERYRIVTAASGAEGLDILQQQPISLIISDHRMPEMLGSEFLSRSREIAPDAVRILLTGYADIDAVTEAVNQGAIARYINKPWNDDEIKQTVRDLLKQVELERENSRLTAELIEKNRALEDFNARLEQAVDQRTHELQLKIKELSGRDQIAHFMLGIHTLEETLQFLLQIAGQIIPVEAAVIYLTSEGTIRPVAALDASGYTTVAPDELHKVQPSPLHAEAFKRVSDTMESTYVAQTESPTVSPFVLAPMVRQDELLGFIEISAPTKGAISDDELSVVTRFAVQAAMAINDAQAHSDMNTWKGELAAVLKDWDL
jgi:CheY-like chemotaxis protein